MKPNLATLKQESKTLRQIVREVNEQSAGKTQCDVHPIWIPVGDDKQWVPLSKVEEFGGALRQLRQDVEGDFGQNRDMDRLVNAKLKIIDMVLGDAEDTP